MGWALCCGSLKGEGIRRGEVRAAGAVKAVQKSSRSGPSAVAGNAQSKLRACWVDRVVAVWPARAQIQAWGGLGLSLTRCSYSCLWGGTGGTGGKVPGRDRRVAETRTTNLKILNNAFGGLSVAGGKWARGAGSSSSSSRDCFTSQINIKSHGFTAERGRRDV